MRLRLRPHSPSSTHTSRVCAPQGKGTDELTSIQESLTAAAKKHLSSSETETIKWQYIGSEEGWFSAYPARTDPSCGAYDPRFRPWYAAAASVPKAVIVIVDSSGSMATGGRMAAAKAATATVIDTLDAGDAIAVIDFDSAARSPTEGCLADTMIPATAENKAKMKGFVAGMAEGGATNFDAAFAKADTILRDEVSRSVIGDKPVMVLFMTDGESSDQTRVADIIKGWGSLETQKPVLLAFGFGEGADMSALNKIAQMSEGPDAEAKEVNDADIRTSMAKYYQHPSLAHKPGAAHVAMSAPYIDSSGLGLVVTLSLPLYDEETKKLWGVAGIDITLSDMIMPVKGMRYGNHGYGEIPGPTRGRLLPSCCCRCRRVCRRRRRASHCGCGWGHLPMLPSTPRHRTLPKQQRNLRPTPLSCPLCDHPLCPLCALSVPSLCRRRQAF